MAESLAVKHLRLGYGQLIQVHQGGQFWEVRFESGKCYRLPSSEFEPLPTHIPPDHTAARRTIETLRMGIVPTDHIEDLTLGLSSQRAHLHNALKLAHRHNGAALAILADYGCGKTHFIELAARAALREGFLVATLSLDAREMPPAHAQKIYQAAIQGLRYPDSSSTGIQPLLNRARQHPAETLKVLESAAKGVDCPFTYAVRAYLHCESLVGQIGIALWLSRQFVPKEADIYLKKAPRLYANGEVARQYTYLLSGISALATAMGYQGLALFIDEVDYYSRQTTAQKQRANMLFKALLCASQGETNMHPDAAYIAQHQKVIYPLRFNATSPFFFLFASTESEQQIPVQAWLRPSQILRLDERFDQSEVAHFISIISLYHAQAYQRTNPVQSFIPRLAAVLSAALRERRINPRQLSQITVTFHDLLYIYPQVSPEKLIRDLAIGLRIPDTTQP